MTDKKQTKPPSFFKRLIDKLDKKLKEKSNNSCGCKSDKDNSCCS